MNILIVEDQVNFAKAVATLLRQNNYTVDVAYDGEDGCNKIARGIYDVVLLDIMLPKIDGIEVLRRVRGAKNETPILLLTAKSQLDDKVYGLDMGADDYLTKPFEYEELLARIRVLTRRRVDVFGDIISFSDLEYCVKTYTLKGKDHQLELTSKETQLVDLFLSNPNVIIKKELALDKLCGIDNDITLNNVEVYVHFIRKKLALLSDKVRIRTV